MDQKHLIPVLALLVVSMTMLGTVVATITLPRDQTAAAGLAGQGVNANSGTHTIQNIALTVTDSSLDQSDTYACPTCHPPLHALTSVIGNEEYHFSNWIQQFLDSSANHSDIERTYKSTWTFDDGTVMRDYNHSYNGYPINSAENEYTCVGDPIPNDPICINSSDNVPTGRPAALQSYGTLKFVTEAAPQYTAKNLPDIIPYFQNLEFNVSPKGVRPKISSKSIRTYSLTAKSSISLGMVGDQGDYDVTLGVNLISYYYEVPQYEDPIPHAHYIPCENISIAHQYAHYSALEKACIVKLRASASPSGVTIDVTPAEGGGDATKFFYEYQVWLLSSPSYIGPTQTAQNTDIIGTTNVNSVPSGFIGDTISLSGTGLGNGSNQVTLSNVQGNTYNIPSILSSDGSKINFILDGSLVTPGTYTVWLNGVPTGMSLIVLPGSLSNSKTFSPGKIVIVSTNNANLRSWPSVSTAVLSSQPFGLPAVIKGGPVFNDGYVWWYIVSGPQTSGWMIENALKLGDNTPPSIPGHLRITSISPSGVDFAWDASTDNSFIPPTYQIYIDGKTAGLSTTLTHTSLRTGFFAPNVALLAPGVSRKITLVAVDKYHNASLQSIPLVVMIPFVTTTPSPTPINPNNPAPHYSSAPTPVFSPGPTPSRTPTF